MSSDCATIALPVSCSFNLARVVSCDSVTIHFPVDLGDAPMLEFGSIYLYVKKKMVVVIKYGKTAFMVMQY